MGSSHPYPLKGLKMLFLLGDAKPGSELGKLGLPHPHFHLTMSAPHLQLHGEALSSGMADGFCWVLGTALKPFPGAKHHLLTHCSAWS